MLKHGASEDSMKNSIIISALSIAIILLTLYPVVNAQNLDALNDEITITTNNNEDMEVVELLTLKTNTNQSIDLINFWIQTEAKNVNILVNNSTYTYTKNEAVYTVDISDLNLTLNTQITVEINYLLEKNTQNFHKKLLQKTDSLEITFDGKIIYTGSQLAIDSSLSVPLSKTVET